MAEEDVGALRRAVGRMAAGQSGVRPGAAELVATELGTNLLRHAVDGGYVLARKAGDGIELISVDHGPGMPPGMPSPAPEAAPAPYRGLGAAAQPAAPRHHGLSPATGPTPPHHPRFTPAPPPHRGRGMNAGLNVVRRQAAEFDWYSTRRGTVVYARLGTVPPVVPGGWRFGGVNIPYGGDGESGDTWAVAPDRRLSALVVDGLGHGPGAAVAARTAVREFERRTVTALEPFVRHAHEVMRGTRGGVLGACLIDPGHGELTFAAVGNVTGRVLTGTRSIHLLDRPGTLGTHIPLPTIRPQHCAWEPGSVLILVSDGIRSGWNLDDHPLLLGRHPAIVAAVVHREYGRANDDATVLVVRQEGGMSS